MQQGVGESAKAFLVRLESRKRVLNNLMYNALGLREKYLNLEMRQLDEMIRAIKTLTKDDDNEKRTS